MFKKTILILMIVLLPVLLLAGGHYQQWTGTKTNYQYSDSTDALDLRDYNSFSIRFRITAPDTSKTDSTTIYLQRSSDKTTWTTFYTFDEYASDTSTKYLYLPQDSMLVYPIDRYVRLFISTTGIATTDSGSSEVLQATGNGTTLDWLNVNKGSPGADTTRWSVINETAIDTTDYDSTQTVNTFLVVTCANRTKREMDIDSVKMTVRGGYMTDTCAFRFGITLADTATAKRSLSDSTLMVSGGAGTYTENFATNPYGTAWTQAQVDSLGMIFESLWIASGASAKISQAYLTVYYAKGVFSPPMDWQVNWNFRP